MKRKTIFHMRGRLAAVALAAAVLFAACGGGDVSEGPITLRINVDAIGKALELNRELARQYEAEHNVKIEFIVGPPSATERLTQYLQYLSARSPDIDIYQIDVIWPGTLGGHFVPLNAAMTDELDAFFEPIVRNNTVNGNLIAIPYYGDAGLLYYRTDLLEKYGYDGPPETWAELEKMARTVQQGERGEGRDVFWGYVWQGAAYEGLTCNALEVQVSHGGGTIVSRERKVTVNNNETARALETMASWVGEISPPGVTSYKEEEARNLFQSGRAAFMRNWPYAYPLAQGEDSAIRGRFDIAMLPSGGAGPTATLGGWQLAVSRYSKHPDEAIAFAKYLTSYEAQKRRAVEAGLIPTRRAVFEDPEVAAAVPYFVRLEEVLANATPRPSTPAGDHYNEVSTRYFQAVHSVLNGQQEAPEALAELEATLVSILD